MLNDARCMSTHLNNNSLRAILLHTFKRDHVRLHRARERAVMPQRERAQRRAWPQADVSPDHCMDGLVRSAEGATRGPRPPTFGLERRRERDVQREVELRELRAELAQHAAGVLRRVQPHDQCERAQRVPRGRGEHPGCDVAQAVRVDGARVEPDAC